MHTLLMHRHDCPHCGPTLKASDQLAEEDLLTFKVGKDFMVEAKQARSLQHHRLLFALLRKVARSTPVTLNEQALLSWVKVKTGHVEVLPLGFGQTYEAPASITFQNMDQAQFREFFERVVQLVLTELCPLLPPSFADEFTGMLDNPSPSRDARHAPADAVGAEPSPSPPPAEATAPQPPVVVLAEDLNGAPAERVLAWADLFEAKLRGCLLASEAKMYWTAADDCGRFKALVRVDRARFDALYAIAKSIGQQRCAA